MLDCEHIKWNSNRSGINLDFDNVTIHFVTNESLDPVKLHNNCLHYLTFHLSIAPGDYDALTNFPLGPFSDDVRELSFNVSIMNDSIPEDDETFNVSLKLDSADHDRLGDRVIVSPDVATVIIQDNDGKHA